SNEEKLQIEKCGREIVKRELSDKGYHIEDMPQRNPGFDIKATKQNEEIYVEVKAHSGKSNVVSLTSREYKEYVLCNRSNSNTKWQLWNVQNLTKDSSDSVTIFCCEEIPEEALTEKEFRVDLSCCPEIKW
ncbi:MAG: DUF3883 domain-containing protein, partial [bacterium]